MHPADGLIPGIKELRMAGANHPEFFPPTHQVRSIIRTFFFFFKLSEVGRGQRLLQLEVSIYLSSFPDIVDI